MTDWGVVLATVVGPIVAVVITLWYQDRDRTYNRRFSVFSTMMRWRRHPLSIDFVGSLNMVPVEFSNKPVVMERYGELFKLFEDTGWESGKPETIGRLHDQIGAKVAELLSEMAKTLSINIDQIRILRGAYHPRGWVDEEETTRQGREQLIRVLRGEVPIPVVVLTPPPDTGADRDEPAR